MLVIGFIRQFELVDRDSGTIEGGDFLFSLRRFYSLFGAAFICTCSSQSERDLSVVHT